MTPFAQLTERLSKGVHRPYLVRADAVLAVHQCGEHPTSGCVVRLSDGSRVTVRESYPQLVQFLASTAGGQADLAPVLRALWEALRGREALDDLAEDDAPSEDDRRRLDLLRSVARLVDDPPKGGAE